MSSHVALSNAIIVHGIFFGLAFVIFMPLGGILIRLNRTPLGTTLHSVIQLLSLALSIVGLGLGVWFGKAFDKLHSTHAYIGFVLVALLALQPLSGLLRHKGEKTAGRAPAAWVHVMFGRGVVLLGVINGGLGSRLAWTSPAKSERGAIAWGVLSGVVFVAYVGVVVLTTGSKGKTQVTEGGEEGTEVSGSDEKLSRTGSTWTEATTTEMAKVMEII